MSLKEPLYRLGDAVVESIGAKDSRFQHKTTISTVYKNGNLKTKTDNLYSSVGLAMPAPVDDAGYRSIRKAK